MCNYRIKVFFPISHFGDIFELNKITRVFTLQYQKVDQRGPSLIILITSNTKGMYYFVKAYDKLNVCLNII